MVASRRCSRREQVAAAGAVLLMQVVGTIVLGFGVLAGWECVETGSCSDGSPVVSIVFAAAGLMMLYGGFVAGARTAKLDRPVLAGLAAFVVAWGGGVLVSIVAGRRPVVGVVFVVGVAFVLVAERRGPALAATAVATLVMALKDLSNRGTSSGMVAVTLVVLVALVALVPEGQPSSPAEDRTAT
jgi:hypothetical protein